MSLIKEKVNQAKQILKEMDIDCWITFTRESQINGDPILPFLISADVTWHSAFIITKTGKAFAIVGLYDQKTVEETAAYDEVFGFVEGVKERFQKLMQKINPDKIALNYSEGSEICDGLTLGMYLTLFNHLKDLKMESRIISAENIVSAMRERKTVYELENIQQAINITEEIFEAVSKFIKPGKSEKEIAAFMKNEVKKRDLEFAWEETVCPAVFTGPETAGAHYAPSDKKIEKGHVLNMDFGVRVNGYCSDMQRTFYILEDNETIAPTEVQIGFDTIHRAIEDSRLAVKIGGIGLDVDAAARKVITDAGFEEFPHGLGHQVGRFSHDGTALFGPAWEKYAQKPFKTLEENMVFTIEPRLTVEGRGVVTIEEMVVIKKDGAEYLSHPQKELILIKS